MRHTTSLRVVGAVALLLAGALATVGCAAEPSGAPSADTGESTPSEDALTKTPEPTLEDLRHERAVELVESATVRERVSSIVMATAGGVDAASLSGFTDRMGLGGFILMGDNVPATPDELRALTDQLVGDPAYPRLIAIDQEGGVVSRVPWDTYAAASTLKYDDPSASQQAFASRATMLQEAGITVNFGIVADYTADPSSFIFERSLGMTPADSAARVEAAVEGESGTVVSTLKHFPGHGAAAGDSHASIPETAIDYETWLAEESTPFKAGVTAGADMLMFGHLRYSSIDALPASLSPEWHRIAREELGFDGISVSDDLGMLLSSGIPEYLDPAQNAIQALNAGNDLLVVVVGADEGTLTATIDGVTAAAEQGVVGVERLNDAAVRVAELRLEIGEGETDDSPSAGN